MAPHLLLAHVLQPHATVRQMVWYASPYLVTYQRQDRAYGYARQLLGLMLLSQSADVFIWFCTCCIRCSCLATLGGA